MAKFINTLSESILTVAEIQDCSTRGIKVIANSSVGEVAVVKAQITGIDTATKNIEFAEQYEQKNSFTITSAEADKYRDRRYTLLMSRARVNAENIEDEPLVAEASQTVLTKLAKYGKKVVTQSRTKESATLNNIFAEFDTEESLALLETAGLSVLYTKLKESQVQYEETDRAKISEAVAKGDYIRPSESIATIVYRLEALFSYIDILAFDDYETHETTIRSLNEIIDSVMTPARARKSKKQALN